MVSRCADLEKAKLSENRTAGAIAVNMVIAAASLFANGFGVYLTIRAGIGAGPWDVLNLGISKSLGILYGTASIVVSLSILLIDIFLKEPIGIAMFIDAVVVGKSVDLFDYLKVVPAPDRLWKSILTLVIGLVIMGYTQYLYMRASLGCGSRDTLLVGLDKRIKMIPIGAISIVLLSLATFFGWLLGGKVGIGTLINAFAAGPIMQFAFFTVRFDAAKIRHQNLHESLRAIRRSFSKKETA